QTVTKYIIFTATVNPDRFHLQRLTPQPSPLSSFGEHHAIGDDLGLAGRESIQDGLALANRCCSVQVLSADTGLDKFVADMARVLDADREADGSPALAVFQPVLDNVADQRVGVHPALKLTDDVVALLRPHAAEVGIDRGIDQPPTIRSATCGHSIIVSKMLP